nr:MAG TPA: alpha-2-macroglobulin domain protein [Caudoviricetes sp.]
MKKIVRGNDFTLRIPVKKIVNGEQVAFPLPACTDIVVNIVNQYRRVALSYTIDTTEDNIINARVEGDAVSVGTYALEVRGKIFGNDWRSKEYEQFAIVDNNASGDTAFNGELIEGEDSVEMNTALVILPPTAELTQLITDANIAVETAKQTDAILEANEHERTVAEQQRVSAETARESAESERSESESFRRTAEVKREDNEDFRKVAESQRDMVENERVTAEQRRVSAETARVAAEKQRATTFTELSANVDAAVSKADSAADAASTATEKANTAEVKRAEAEGQRAEAEVSRSREEGIRQESETERIRKETARDEAEAVRQAAEAERVKADAEREKRVSEAISNTSSATQAATDAATVTTEAGKKATAAATEAERVNVNLQGSTISVTNRNGETKSVDVVNTDEEVTVTITSTVDSIKVAGVKINVFLNNGKTPQTYTTNSEGKATFTIDRGNYYQVTFPEYGNAQPIAPVGYTAVLATRNIDVDYKPYDEESMENVVVTVTKYTDGKGAAYEGVPVVVTVDRKNTTYNADAKGQVSLYVPYGKEFTVNVENQDGYSVSLNRNTRTYTASVPQRLIDYKMYQFRAGIFVIDDNLNEYYLEEWQAAGKTAEEAVAIKVADATLTLNRGTFMIRISDMLAPTALPKKSWCTQNLQFDSIALNGNNTKDANYYNGESSSFLVRQEAVERSLSAPAFDCAYEQIFSIAGHELHGFLMSIGQDYVHIANIGIIKQVLTALYGEEVATAYYNFVMKQYRWTSTQSNATNAWDCSSSAYGNIKSISYYVLPVFAC